MFESRGTHELPAELRDGPRRREQIDALLANLAQAKEEGRAVPKRVPCTDLEARVMPNKDGGQAQNYTPLATVDIASGLIVRASVLDVVNEDAQLVPPDVLASMSCRGGPGGSCDFDVQSKKINKPVSDGL